MAAQFVSLLADAVDEFGEDFQRMKPVHYYYGFNMFNCFSQLQADRAKVCHKEIPDVKAAYIGWSNAIYVTDNGEAYVAGFLGVNKSRGKVSQLRYSKEYLKVSHAVLGRSKFCIITEDGDAYFWKDAESQPDCISDLKNVKDIVLGALEGVVLFSDGTLKLVCYPTLALRSLGGISRILSIACGMGHYLALTNNRAVLSWGNSSHGELGHGTLEGTSIPRVVEALEGILIRDIAAGGWHSCAISDCDDLYIWGWNESGQLALPYPEKDSLAPNGVAVAPLPRLVDSLDCVLSASCGSRHTAAVTGDGSLWTWGSNAYGQLGLDETDKNVYAPQRVSLPENQKATSVKCRFWGTLVTCMVRK